MRFISSTLVLCAFALLGGCEQQSATESSELSAQIGAIKAAPAKPQRATLQISCGKKSYTISTGTGSGSCTQNVGSGGGSCSDGSNKASVDCATGCTSTSGSGSCSND